jgi:hypothetical protein
MKVLQEVFRNGMCYNDGGLRGGGNGLFGLLSEYPKQSTYAQNNLQSTGNIAVSNPAGGM